MIARRSVGARTGPLVVLAWPWRRNEDHNPYTTLLYEAIVAAGPVEVHEFQWRSSWVAPADVWHCHWPGYYLGAGRAKAVAGSFAVLMFALACRLRGVRIVWTVHNLRPHDTRRKMLVAAFHALWTRLVDAVIFLSDYSRHAALRTYPALAGTPWRVIPHGPYVCMVEKARATLAGDVLFVGQVRPYKGVPRLLSLVANSDLVVTIAGVCDDRSLRKDLEAHSNEHHRLQLLLDRLDEATIEGLLHAHRLVVLPYERVLNSGSVLLALSHGLPVIATDHPSLRELRDAVPSGLRLVDPRDLDTVVGASLAEAYWREDVEARCAQLAQYASWPAIARAHLELFAYAAARHDARSKTTQPAEEGPASASGPRL